MKRTLLFLIVICACFASSLSAAERKLIATHIPESEAWAEPPKQFSLPERQHPYLFLNAEDFRQIAARAKDPAFPWAAEKYAELKKHANAALARPLEIPDKPGEWSHHYVCKDCGIRLEEKAGSNVCPRCGKQYTGWPYEGVVAGRKHHQFIDDALTLGLAYQLTSRPDYAKRARDILLGYADRYTSFPIHDYKGTQIVRGARLFAQTLDEAVRMIPLSWAYDLVYNAPGTTAEHRRHIEQNLFRPAALVIRRNDMGISNWQSWHNAAIAAIGYVLEEPAMVNHAINGKSGFFFQMENSVLPDGFWYEGTASYHFYALKALQYQALTMKAAGLDYYKQPRFRALYETPLDYTFPDGTFPAVNDSDPVSIFGEDEHYEVAYAWYNDPKFAGVAKKGARESLEAFLFGSDKLPAGDARPLDSKIFPGLGAVMLRQDTPASPMALHLDYGPHGGGHGHPDKLGIILFANGHDVMPDAGRLQYGAPLHNRWYKTTLAHNTVIVDGENQKATEGQLVSSDLEGPVKIATAVCSTAYQDVTLTRSVALAPEYLLDVMSGADIKGKKHTWDLAYHVKGRPESDLDLTAAELPQNSDGYQVLENVRSAKVDGDWDISFAGKSGKTLRLAQADSGPVQVILGQGVAGSNVTTCPVVISRTTEVKPEWMTLIVPDSADSVQWNCKPSVQGWDITVTASGRTDEYAVRNGEITKIK